MASLVPPSVLIEDIRIIVRHEGSQKAAAKHIGVSAQYLSDVLNRRREISAALAEKLGYTKYVGFVLFAPKED
jgi:plasmid maintenance system antidote protein VapI